MPVYLAENVQRIQDLLEIHQPHLPWPFLLLDYRFERVGGRPMAASGVEENEVQLFLSNVQFVHKYVLSQEHVRRKPRQTSGEHQVEIISSTECNKPGGIF